MGGIEASGLSPSGTVAPRTEPHSTLLDPQQISGKGVISPCVLPLAAQ
jgi:hypothetical protein